MGCIGVEVTDDDSKVIKVDFESRDLPVTIRNRAKKNFCTHTPFVLYEDSRTVVCKRCGNEIDPFEAHLIMARKWNRLIIGVKGLRNDKERLEKKIEALRVEEKRIKGRIRYARKKEVKSS